MVFVEATGEKMVSSQQREDGGDEMRSFMGIKSGK